MTKIIYKDGFDGMVKIIRTEDAESFLKHNKITKVIAMKNF